MRNWRNKFERWLETRLPLGISAKRERVNLMLGLSLSVLWAVLAYMWAYGIALSDLYTTQNGKRILLLDARMADFGQVFRFVPAGYLIFIGLLVAKGFWFQAYHRQGSMSIYLMRRLPDPREYARRCWTSPLVGVGMCLVLTAVTTAVCYLIYMKCTPATCLMPGQWTRFWSALVGR